MTRSIIFAAYVLLNAFTNCSTLGASEECDSMDETETAQAKHTMLNQKMSLLEAEIELTAKDIDKAASNLKSATEVLSSECDGLNKLSSVMNSIKLEIESLANERDVLAEEVSWLKSSIASNSSKIWILEETVESLSNERDLLNAFVASLDDDLVTFREMNQTLSGLYRERHRLLEHISLLEEQLIENMLRSDEMIVLDNCYFKLALGACTMKWFD
jgi:chromosome segregation ATPase